MTQSKHTPGPWAVAVAGRSESPHSRVIGAKGLPVAGVWSSDNTDAGRLANARLIAAAPDMLGALDELLAAAELHERPSDAALEAAQQAIRKATGGEG